MSGRALSVCGLCLLVTATLLQPSSVRAEPPPAREPTVAEVIRLAQRTARTLGPARIRELARRARLRGLVPQLRLAAERGLQQDLSSTRSVQSSDREQAETGDDLRFSATLTFDLDRLVFAAEEVRLLSIGRWLEGDLRKLIVEVVRLYFQRRRLIRELAEAHGDDPEIADRLAETEALLNAYTDGAFERGR